MHLRPLLFLWGAAMAVAICCWEGNAVQANGKGGHPSAKSGGATHKASHPHAKPSGPNHNGFHPNTHVVGPGNHVNHAKSGPTSAQTAKNNSQILTFTDPAH